MKTLNPDNPIRNSLGRLARAVAMAAGLAMPVTAAPVATLTSENANPFDTGAAHAGPLIQATVGDLLETSLSSTSQSAPAGNNYNVPSVYDGAIVTGWNRPAGYWGSATPGASYVEFNLNTTAAPLGYNISSIKVIHWGDGPRLKQAWKVSFKPVGSSTFTDFYTLPETGVASKVNQVVLADDAAALLAGGVAAIRFDFGDSGTNNGWTWYHEIDVMGAAIGDSTPPAITTLSPTDGADNVALGSNLVTTFNEAIAIGTGDITLKNLTDGPGFDLPIAVTDSSQVSVAGAVLTINPTANLVGGKAYAIRIPNTAIKDLANNAFPGIANDTTWNFATDITPPSIVTRSPADNATGVDSVTNLVLNFSEAITIGTGNITLKNLTDGPGYDLTIAITDASQVSVAGAVLTINPTANLAGARSYAIQIDATAIKDPSGLFFAGIADVTTWNFTVSNLAATLTSETATSFDTGVAHTGPLIQATVGDLLETSLSSITQSGIGEARHVPSTVYDGAIVTGYNSLAGYWGHPTPGTHYIEFNLNTTAAPLGYNISSIKVIHWGDSFRPGQAWKVSFKPVGSSTFTDFYTLPATGVANKVNQVVLADVTAALLASGVATLRFDFGPTKPGYDWTWYHEIDVMGTAISSSPYDNWANGTFVPPLTAKLPNDDQDVDGLKNIQEYAFGTQPTVSTGGSITYVAGGAITATGPPVATNFGGVDYRAVFGRRKDYVAAGLTYTPQFSVTMAEGAWVNSTDTPTVLTGAGGANPSEIEAVSVPYPLFIPHTRDGIPGFEKPTFFRVGVSQP